MSFTRWPIDDHAARPGPLHWDFKCTICERDVELHAPMLVRLWRHGHRYEVWVKYQEEPKPLDMADLRRPAALVTRWEKPVRVTWTRAGAERLIRDLEQDTGIGMMMLSTGIIPTFDVRRR